jgi:hypothetical protein
MLIEIMPKVAKRGRTFRVSQGGQPAWGTGLSLRAAAGRVAIPASGPLNVASFNVRKGAHQQWQFSLQLKAPLILKLFSGSVLIIAIKWSGL